MITLKDYQERVLDSVREFFRQCSRDGRPEEAFATVQRQNGREPTPYLPVHAAGLAPGMPYVCLRVPTGGGKTLLACYAAGLAMHELLRAERAVVLWLVPSTAILDQTADALRDPRHPYRRALELACGAVEVVTIEEALHLARHGGRPHRGHRRHHAILPRGGHHRAQSVRPKRRVRRTSAESSY